MEMPVGSRPRAYAIFAHCFTCGKNALAATHIARFLTTRNIAVLRFDFTGLGDSEGDFGNTNFSSNVQDLVAAADYLSEHYEVPQLLIGHSLGGAAVLMAARSLPSVKAVVAIAAPATPEHVKRLFIKEMDDIQAEGEAEVSIGGRNFTIRRQFVNDLMKNRLEEELPQLQKAVLIMHSPQDKVVHIDNAARLYALAKHPKSFISLDGANHLLTDKEAAGYTGEVIASWASRYLSVPPIDESGEGVVAVRTGTEKYYTEISIGQHMMVADEPAKDGGKDLGPTPYDYLLGALGACTSMTLRMYADHKKWKLDEARVRLEHSRSHVADCQKTADNHCRVEKINRVVELEGDLSPEQRQRLIEIAEKCPIHKTLTGDLTIETLEKKE